jgi:hypothetical protein
VEFVNFTSGRNVHALANSGLNCQLHGYRIGDTANNRALGVLLEQFGQNCGAVARSSGATAVGEIAKYDRPFVRIDRLAHRFFDRNHVGVKGVALRPARVLGAQTGR